MPTQIKQLKVINNATLAKDGTFSIGLRDNLVIKPNSKVALSKFLYKESSPLQTAINLETTTFQLTTDVVGFPLVSRKTPPRTITIPKQIFLNVTELVSDMNELCSEALVCGDVGGSKTFSDYVTQKLTNPTNDNGLDILFNPNGVNGNIVFAYLTNKIQMAFSEDNAINVNRQGIAIESDLDERGDIGVSVINLDEYWGVSDINSITKGAFQSYIQVNQEGMAGVDWMFGLRYSNESSVGNTSAVRMGIYKGVDGSYYLVDDGVIKDTPIAYTFTAGDFFILFTSNGGMYLQIYNGATNNEGINNVTTKVYESPPYQLYNQEKQLLDVNYRPCITKGVNNVDEPQPPENKPFFRQIYWTTRSNVSEDLSTYTPNGLGRYIQMDLTQSGELANWLGLPSLLLTSPQRTTYATFLGTQIPNFYRVQDLALYWSLPAQTYVGNQTKTRNGRENMIASFTPTRQLTSTDNLFFQEQLEYTDIGNLDTMNISTIQFRLINEFPNGNTQVITNYLSFVLFIKEEY
jgi:hypothetical protein